MKRNADLRYPACVPDKDTWKPDDQLVAAVLAGGPHRMGDLSTLDRCWVVAGLQAKKLTAEQIADHLDCSVRLVRTIIAETGTAVCKTLMIEVDAFASEIRLRDSELRRLTAEAAVKAEAAEKVRKQLQRLIAARGGEVKRCSSGHALVPHNVMVRPNGREDCRECHCERQRAWRRGMTVAQYREARRTEGVTISA